MRSRPARLQPRRPLRRLGGVVIALAGLAGAAMTLPAAGQEDRRRPTFADDVVAELDVKPIDRLGSQVPPGLSFVDQDGTPVTLDDYFGRGMPVILTLNYFRCPMLCIETLNGLIDGLQQVDWRAGRDFAILTVSFNPEEGPELAGAKRTNYLNRYGFEVGNRGWDFLTGEKDQIDALCEAVGFQYKFVPETGEYSHPASVIFLDPDGVVTLHMNDVLYKPGDLRLAIVEASKGTVGTWVDDVFLFTCFQWDPNSGSYTPSILKLMRTAGALFVVGLVLFVIVLSRRRSGGIGAGTSGGSPLPEKVVTS